MNTVTYPTKKFFKQGRNLAWKKEDFMVVFENDRTVDILNNSMSFFNGGTSDLGFFDIAKLFTRTTYFLALYYYSVGNGYQATFMLDEKKVVFEWIS